MADLLSVRRGVVMGVALLSSGQGAAAAELQVDGPRSCSRATELRSRVERALGRSLSELGEVSCRVHVVRDGGSYAARVELSSAAQTPALRSFSAKTCPKLMDTLELAVVLAMGADHGAGVELGPDQLGSMAPTTSSEQRGARSDASRSVSPDAALTSEVSTLAKEAPASKAPIGFAASAPISASAEPAPAPSSPRATAPRASIASTAGADVSPIEAEEGVSSDRSLWRAFGGLVIDAGALPGPALGAQLGGSFGGAVELRALGTYLLPRESFVPAGAGAPLAGGIGFALATGAVLGCAARLARVGHVELGACAGGELGVLWSDASDSITRSRSTETLWSAMRADVGARWTPSWFGIEARLGLSVPLSRPRFSVLASDGANELYRPTAVGGRLSVAATFALGGSR